MSTWVRRFLRGDDEERANRFKLIPTVAKGSWIIKQSVGHTPVLLGHKLKTQYFRYPPHPPAPFTGYVA